MPPPHTLRLVPTKPPAVVSNLKALAEGTLLIFEPPRNEHRYVLGVDPSQGTGNDNAVIQVLRVGTRTELTEQVAEFASPHWEPFALAELVSEIGRLYRGYEDEAHVIVEINSAGGGPSCLNDLRVRWGYGNLYSRRRYDRTSQQHVQLFGFATNQGTRGELIARGITMLRDQHVKLNSPLLLDEMGTFEADHSLAQANAAHGQKDDRVLAFLLALQAAHEGEWASGEDVGRLRDLTVSPSALHSQDRPPDAPSPQATVRRDGEYDGDDALYQYDWLSDY